MTSVINKSTLQLQRSNTKEIFDEYHNNLLDIEVQFKEGEKTSQINTLLEKISKL